MNSTALYNGEVKTPDDEEEDIGCDDFVEGSEEKENEETNTVHAGSESDSNNTTAISPQKQAETVASRNPSPGRSRRSGILFKKQQKKHYQPTKPSPLVLYSNSTSAGKFTMTTTTAGGGGDDDLMVTSPKKQHSPLKLRLRIDSSGKAR